MSEMVDELEQLSRTTELEEYVNAVDESLGELEDYYNDEEFLEDEEDEFISRLSRMWRKVYFEEDVLDDRTVIEITCPNCGTIVF